MQNRIDLRPLYCQSDAVVMVLLARGQLNRAFRKHGLLPPDSLSAADWDGVDDDCLDDPVALGMEQAAMRFGDSFWEWAHNLPTILVRPVLDILLQTWRLHGDGHGVEGVAGPSILAAYEFLLGRLELLDRQ